MGVQYLLYLQSLAKKRSDTHYVYTQYEKENCQKLREFKRKQEAKLKDLERKIDHADYLISAYDQKLKKIRAKSAIRPLVKGGLELVSPIKESPLKPRGQSSLKFEVPNKKVAKKRYDEDD